MPAQLNSPVSHSPVEYAVLLCLIGGSVLLAWTPAVWLVQTWFAPGYDRFGMVVFCLVLGLMLWSWTSPKRSLAGGASDATATDRLMWLLLVASACLRLLAQLLDINVVGALLLCVDVYAIARLAGLADRERTVSPFWLGALFCFCLPLEPMLQRVLGYGLQQVSAAVACGMLQPFDVTCEGLRLQLAARDVLVDLPCSGAQLLSTIGVVFCGLNVLRPPAPRWVIPALCLCLLLAILGNGLRISLLALGIAYAELVGVDVMLPLPHTLVGLAVISLVALVLFTLLERLPRQAASLHCAAPIAGGAQSTSQSLVTWSRSIFAASFLAFAAAVGSIESQPVDASPSLIPPDAPLAAAGFFA